MKSYTYAEFERVFLPGLREKHRLEALKQDPKAWGQELAKETMEKVRREVMPCDRDSQTADSIP